MKEILELPYIQFVIGMADAPQICYKKKEDDVILTNSAEEEILAVTKALG